MESADFSARLSWPKKKKNLQTAFGDELFGFERLRPLAKGKAGDENRLDGRIGIIFRLRDQLLLFVESEKFEEETSHRRVGEILWNVWVVWVSAQRQPNNIFALDFLQIIILGNKGSSRVLLTKELMQDMLVDLLLCFFAQKSEGKNFHQVSVSVRVRLAVRD
jgi:hypothetical protein